jgi:hypothetical protein
LEIERRRKRRRMNALNKIIKRREKYYKSTFFTEFSKGIKILDGEDNVYLVDRKAVYVLSS